MTNYSIGARLERLWIAQMKRRGYRAMRSAGSKGLIDCIAWNDQEIIMAQIKNNRMAYSSRDIEALKAMPRPYAARVVLYERFGANGVDWKEIDCPYEGANERLYE